ncbi:hypothetical protein pb186bvf_010020 [Paramecium bursaria]
MRMYPYIITFYIDIIFLIILNIYQLFNLILNLNQMANGIYDSTQIIVSGYYLIWFISFQ